MKSIIYAGLFLGTLLGCKDKSMPQPANQTDTAVISASYLALGDSYTVGEDVQTAESFPYQLSAKLKPQQIELTPTTVVARTGWTTADLKEGIKEKNVTGTFDVVTLLIGVNNQYRGYPVEEYRSEFQELLAAAIKFTGDKKDRVFVLSIPDWSVTPFGGNEKGVAAEIDAFNSVNKEESFRSGITYIDITPLSRTYTGQQYVAEDGLHPSGKMYSLWVDKLAPEVLKAIKK